MDTTIQARQDDAFGLAHSFSEKAPAEKEFWNLIIESMTPKRISAVLSIVLFYAALTLIVSLA